MIPQSLVLKGITYKVLEVDKIPPKSVKGGKRKETILGAFDWWKNTIEIRKDTPPERKEITLIHEILHVLTEGFSLTEAQLDQLAWDLYDALKRNALSF